jgi:hypothetical protein
VDSYGGLDSAMPTTIWENHDRQSPSCMALKTFGLTAASTSLSDETLSEPPLAKREAAAKSGHIESGACDKAIE